MTLRVAFVRTDGVLEARAIVIRKSREDLQAEIDQGNRKSLAQSETVDYVELNGTISEFMSALCTNGILREGVEDFLSRIYNLRKKF